MALAVRSRLRRVFFAPRADAPVSLVHGSSMPRLHRFSLFSSNLAAAVLALGAPQLAQAADLAVPHETTQPVNSAPVSSSPVSSAPSPFSADGGVTVTNFYVERGVFIATQGVVFHPYGDVYYNAYSGKGFINSVTYGVGFWSVLNTAGTPAADNVSGFLAGFTELDFIPSVTVQFADRYSLTAKFNHWFSPSGAYGPGNWLNATLAYNDAGQTLPNFSIKPYLNVLYELPGASYPGLTPHGWYFEPGLSPNYTFNASSKTPINFAVPVAVGLGDGFYNGVTYGYFNIGPQISAPLTVFPSRYGKLNATLGYKYWNLGTTAAAANPLRRNNESQVLLSLDWAS